ncbi:unnamed protein product [Euphydryas editha]|uniref:C-type lectin domain-containing protein n=1 Tax=Euphydryas editha TaxID=104508 RepID=A0AAU9TU08_EUPED|nr:unnamed protein product [Euphydryas editha]
MCIHNSWIVTRNGDNVMVACPLRSKVLLTVYPSMVFAVYSATLEYGTDDVNEGMQFLRGKMTEYVQELLASDFEEATSILRQLLQKIVFVRYPPSDLKENILRYLKENFPVFCHWQTYLAALYYQTDNLGDALLYASHYTSPNEAQSKPIPTTTTNIKNSIVNESFFDVSTATRELTLTEQLKMIRPLVVSILRSIDLCSDEYISQLQASRNNPHYEYLMMQACTYAKFLLNKVNNKSRFKRKILLSPEMLKIWRHSSPILNPTNGLTSQDFIGIHSLNTEGHWETINGESAKYINWSQDWAGGRQPSTPSAQKCGSLLKQGGMDDVECFF